ncbi:hypothetical protein VN97_g9816 [Penicillium thymicola]|uniref:Uncharacterized protein n=1 Tax=Penicillium thymicola TaxID=293382 RepID=A0AAI9X4I6_PENTH|nr:hypothetical protein VN97_g9816 [Penicillium thymicola]
MGNMQTPDVKHLRFWIRSLQHNSIQFNTIQFRFSSDSVQIQIQFRSRFSSDPDSVQIQFRYSSDTVQIQFNLGIQTSLSIVTTSNMNQSQSYVPVAYSRP